MSSKVVKKGKNMKKTMDTNAVKTAMSKDSSPNREKRLSDKEFKELEHSVYGEVVKFECLMDGVLKRHAWAALLKDAIKHHPDALTDEQKSRIEHVIKGYDDVCEGDAIVMTLKVFSDDACRRRRTFAFEDALREAGGGGPKSRVGKCRLRAIGKGTPHPKARLRK